MFTNWVDILSGQKILKVNKLKFIVTGGAGFIGSAVIRHLVNDYQYEVLNIDKLTYAGDLDTLDNLDKTKLHLFEKVDICDQSRVDVLFEKFKPDVVMHLAAESHVDRSIDSSMEFINSNIIGTYSMLEASRKYLQSATNEKIDNFRFHHISTDEVYGDLHGTDDLFTEDTPYNPSSPYSASKASSDHLVRAWHRTYNLPIVVTNCSNNYGPYQFPEKLIPVVILKAISGLPIPIYGKGDQIRDWLYVEDHARALVDVILNGNIGETYNIGGHNEKTNLEVVKTICEILDDLVPSDQSNINKYEDLISYVTDRPGHDLRYAIDATKIKNDIGWVPQETFESGIRKTIEWYLSHRDWLDKN